jgi:hypothetical protein
MAGHGLCKLNEGTEAHYEYSDESILKPEYMEPESRRLILQ